MLYWHLRSIRDIFKYWDYFEDASFPLYALFLYTNEDQTIAAYVSRHFDEFDRMSGNTCMIFVIEKPSRTWEQKAQTRQYWLNVEAKRNLENDWMELMPYDKSEIYPIARLIEVPYSDLPCIVFFSDINKMELATYKIDPSWSDQEITKEVRELFSAIRPTFNEEHDLSLGDLKEGVWQKLKNFITKKEIQKSIGQVIRTSERVADLISKLK